MIYNPYPEIDLPFGNDNKYFKWLFDAISQVSKDFITYSFKDAKYEEECLSHVERVFAYELYRRFADILEKNGVSSLVLNGEVNKCINDEIKKQTRDNESGKNTTVFPDLVLHESQSSLKDQKIIIEIKRKEGIKNKEDLFRDFLKISHYLKDSIFWKNPFQYGVLLLEGEGVKLKDLHINDEQKVSFADWQEYTFSEYKNDEKFKLKFENIVCVAYNGTTLEYETLDKIIK